MKAIALHLQKGGVGKTSLSASIAYELSREGKTIILDCDPQGNISSWLTLLQPRHELAEVLMGKVDYDKAISPTVVQGLDIIPTFGLDGELKVYAENGLSAEPFILCDLVELLAGHGYDYVVLDLSPGAGRLERAALIASSEVITPMSAEEFSIDGIAIFSHELKLTEKAMRRAPAFKRVIINAYDGRIKQHQEIAARAKETLPHEIFSIGVDPAFRKAQAAHVGLQDLPKKDAAKPETLAELKRIKEAILWH